jgi:hypothetical protein
MIEDNVGYSREMRMSCNEHSRKRKLRVFFEMCVDCHDAVYATRAEKLRIG